MELNIEIIDFKHPIFQSELVVWMSKLTKLNTKEKNNLNQIYRRILSLIDNPDDFIPDNLRIFIKKTAASFFFYEYRFVFLASFTSTLRSSSAACQL